MKCTFLLEDHDVFRQALAEVLNREPDLETDGQARTLEEARRRVEDHIEEIDVAVVDLMLPDGAGVDVVRELHQRKPQLPVLVVTRARERVVHESLSCRIITETMEGDGDMNLWLLKPGHKIRTREGSEAEVLSETADGEWIRVRYLEGGNNSLFVGTEDLLTEGEVEALLGVARTGGWSEKVTVILHHIRESEESEEGYEAVTTKGVPYDVSITGSDSESAEGAINHLLNGLKSFGFTGSITVEDMPHIGEARRYEIPLSRLLH